MIQPHFIVFANEKGGTGKSTTAVHTAIALAAMGHKVAALDLDSRQRTMTRYLENRDATMRRLEHRLPQARYAVLEGQTAEGLDLALRELGEGVDVIVIDTPGRDDPIARAAILKADTLVTPMNDSFVDLDLIGQVHPENYKITRAELLCRADLEQPHAAREEHRQKRRLGRAPQPPAAYREPQPSPRRRRARRARPPRRLPGDPGPRRARHLPRAFPQGPDSPRFKQIGEVGIGHITARQELREMIAGLGIPDAEQESSAGTLADSSRCGLNQTRL